MAIYHFSAKIISRKKGQSAIAAAAYRSGERLYDEQTGEAKFYRSGSERILFSDIMAPKDAPEWAHDRNRLWNEAERAEKRSDSQLAREIEVSLPHELDQQQREWLVKDFAREAFVRKGHAVDIAIHAPYGDSDARNYHAHLMVTQRTVGPEGFAPKKNWHLNKEELGQWREQWADLANRHLERHGYDERIDHRSLEAQGIDREPTTHLGYAAAEMEKRGVESDRGAVLNSILERNEIRVDIQAIDNALVELRQERGATSLQETPDALPPADRGDDESRPAPPGHDEINDDLEQAPEAGQMHQESAFWERQVAWQENASPTSPSFSKAPDNGGLHVVDGATGVVSRLGDYMVDFLASSGSSPEQKQSTDIRSYVSDPQARKQQQLAYLADKRAREADRKAIESIDHDIRAGRNLKSEDIAHLTHEHQEQIRAFGDTAVVRMVDDARRYAKHYWGRERERD